MASVLKIVILFAQKDNEGGVEDNVGWVSHFKTFLELTLYQLIGNKTDITPISDSNNTILSEESKNADFFIPVISAAFIKSQPCLEMLDQVVKNRLLCKANRTLKIMKESPPLSKQPLAARNLPEYNMCLQKPGSRAHIDFFSPESKKQYWPEMLNLAYDIRKEVDKKKHLNLKYLTKPRTIFLAETSPELFPQRNIIKRELQRYGCYILPASSLPATYKECEGVVKKNLEKSDFSIHLIGGYPSKIIEGTDQSIVAMQNHLAAEKSVNAGKEDKRLSRLIWMSPTAKTTKDEQQKSFIETIKRGIDVRDDKTEISEAPFEDFKKMVQEKLIQNKNSTIKITTQPGQKIVYAIYDTTDEKNVQPYLDTITKKMNLAIVKPLFEGEFKDVREHHIQNLYIFDIAIIFKIKANDLWAQMKILDILKSPGVGRSKPILGKIFVAPENNTNQVKNVKDHGITLIDADQDKPLKSFQHCLAKFTQNNTTIR